MYIILFSITFISSVIFFMYYNSTKDIRENKDINEFLLGESIYDENDFNSNNIQTTLNN